jgi:hypothetical protein
MQNVPAAIQVTPTLLGRTTGDLLHPLLIRVPRDPRHVDPAALQVNKEQYIVGHPAPPREQLHGEEVCAS